MERFQPVLGENDDKLLVVSTVSNSVCPKRCEVQICETKVVKQPSHRSSFHSKGTATSSSDMSDARDSGRAYRRLLICSVVSCGVFGGIACSLGELFSGDWEGNVGG